MEEGKYMNKVPNISDAEFQVMKIIWKNPNITANNIIDKLQDETDWKPNTIKTLINRLLKKNAIGFKKEGKEYYYYALLEEETYVCVESNSFLKKVFDNSIKSMMLNFVNNKKLSKKEIQELREILDKAEKQEGN